jgi:hypothetical protein
MKERSLRKDLKEDKALGFTENNGILKFQGRIYVFQIRRRSRIKY